jgi:hypothetical protein
MCFRQEGETLNLSTTQRMRSGGTESSALQPVTVVDDADLLEDTRGATEMRYDAFVQRLQVYNNSIARWISNQTDEKCNPARRLWRLAKATTAYTKKEIDLEAVRHAMQDVGDQTMLLTRTLANEGNCLRVECTFRCNASMLLFLLGDSPTAGVSFCGGPLDNESNMMLAENMMHALIMHVLGEVKARICFWPAKPIALYAQLLVQMHMELTKASLVQLADRKLKDERVDNYWTLCTSISFLSTMLTG